MHTDTPTIRGRVVPQWATALEVRPVRPAERAAWRSLMATHHYLGFRGFVGESLWYVASVDTDWVALVGWAAAAWMVRVRDQWIGWSRPQQWARLKFVVNNARFLILPDVHIPNLASKTLAQNTQRLSADWTAGYGHPVLVAETFVDPTRFAGTSYRAAGWTSLGRTRGFARRHRHYVRHGQPKQVWVHPLSPDGAAPLHAPFLPPALIGGTPTMLDFNTLNWTGPDGLRPRLAALPDPRHRRGIRHRLDHVLLLALAAVLAGQRHYVAISDWIQDLDPAARRLFGCPRWGDTYKVPSEPTLRRVLQQVDPDAVDAILSAWLDTETRRVGDVLAIDGKSLRGSAHGARTRPVHLLAGMVHRTGQVLGQVAVDVKTNEIPRLRDLLAPLDITGHIVTTDALHTQTATARFLVEEKHAHYVMEVKGNQRTLQDACAALELADFSPSGPNDRSGSRPDRTADGAHDDRPE